ncbi:MAG: hypothetical protein DDT23_01122 [candidate division WS2 bacterium]|nr:hypothetical protein [Candidatus Lithacetigena glycinireducens]
MKVWIVGIVDYEENSIKAVYATKEIAERELFKARDKIVAEYARRDIFCNKHIEEFCEKENKPLRVNNMYKEMTDALSGNDYEKWKKNHPFEVPYLYEIEVIEQ